MASSTTRLSIVLGCLFALVALSTLMGSASAHEFAVTLDDPCAQYTNCSSCSQQPTNSTCFWCSYNETVGFCASLANASADLIASCPLWCSGENSNCECAWTTWPCSNHVFGQIILVLFYGILLAYGATMIADGSELLLEIVDPGVIGGLLLPLLGALPDAAIIVVSGATGTAAEAQQQLAIGVGTLAGSTIMLLTLPWSAALYLARCDIRHGESVDNVLTRQFDLTGTGVTMDDDIPLNAKIMMGTAVSYLLVQGVAFAYLQDEQTGESLERWFALGGFIICAICLVGYSAFQVLNPKLQEKKIQEARGKAMMEQTVRAFIDRLKTRTVSVGGPTTPLLAQHEEKPLATPDVRGLGLKWKATAKAKSKQNIQEPDPVVVSIPKEDDEEKEEENEKPENPRAILIKAIILLVIGTFIVSFFSDPMVDVLADFATNLAIPAFYVSFVITPICSNASETISSLLFAAKKKKKNTALTYSQLYGAATMNNTLCLGIFYALIFFRRLTWEFSAETVAILLVVWIVGIIAATQKTVKFFWAFIVVSLYPLSLLLVFLLENFAGWQ